MAEHNGSAEDCLAERLHVRDQGEGPAMLCLHGIGSSSASFADQISQFSTRRRVLAWDAPGYGRSDDVEASPGMAGYADCAAALIRDRVGGRADVLGVSFGGVIAIALALRHPRLVRSLILADTSLGSAASPVAAEKMRNRGSDLRRLGPAALAARRAPKLLSPGASAELVARVEGIMRDSIRLPGYAQAASAMAETDLSDDLSRVAAPTLVVCGALDTVTGPELATVIARGIPGARLRVIPDAGHLSNQERPNDFNAVVAEFLAGLDVGAASARRTHEGGTRDRRRES